MPRLNATHIGLGILAATIVAGPAGAVSVPSDFCTGNPCTISGSVAADAGSVVDFGGRSLILDGSARVTIGPGALPRVLTFIADDITMQPGAEIRGFDDDRAEVTLESKTGAIRLESSGNTRSEINVKANDIDGGNIVILAATDAIIGGRLTASAQGEDATAGSIEITAGGNLTISEEITTEGSGVFAGGGDISGTAVGDITITNKVFAEGSDFGGGDVSFVSTAGSITVSELMSNNGGNPDGEAGEFTFDAAGNFHLTANGEIRGKGGAGADDDCGDGAPTLVDTGGDVIIDGLVSIPGGFQCFGGDFEATVGNDFVQNGNGKIETATGGGFGAGGGVSIAAARGITALKIDTSSAGFGGDQEHTAGLFIDVLDKLNARATGSEGVGARIRLTSCNVNVLAPDGELDTRGPFAFPEFGKNVIRVSGAAIISGDMYAATENEIQHLGLAPVPIGTIDPAPIFIFDPQPPEFTPLLPCANTCGDASVESPEICDDGNITSCDGCSADCTRVDDVCGDGIVECGEQCDDGNAVPGDGCENDCTPTGQSETGVLIEGRGNKVGCQAEWLVQIEDPDTDKKGNPASKQTCIDGDPRCDADGEINDACVILAAPCVNVPDEDLPECDPSKRVEKIVLKKPLPGSKNPQDDANAQALVSSLVSLGTTLEVDGSTVQSGPPVSGTTVCAPTVDLQIPVKGKSTKRTFKLRTTNEEGQVGKRGQLQVKCERNNSVCGDTIVEPGETCDDGNADACDGCFECRTEICGNGRIDCAEECDDGILNGTEGSLCSLECTQLPPELRIPGGGSKKTDCMWQWSMDMGAGDLTIDKRGVPRNKQFCRDNDPLCDSDPTPGNCRVRVFGCAGAENTAISCAGQAVDTVTIRRPKTTAKKAHEAAARGTLDAGVGAMDLPTAAGVESCTTAMEFDIPQGEKLRLSLKAFGVKKDGDSLRIFCD